MNTNTSVVATFQDRYGEERKIHSTRHGLTVKRRSDTPCQVLSKIICDHIGERVRDIRKAKQMTMEELGIKAGLSTASQPKSRVYEIEHNQRGIGLRLGTLYQIAIALEVEISALLPTVEWVKTNSGVRLTNQQLISRIVSV